MNNETYQIFKEINKKLEELLAIRQDFKELKRRIMHIETILEEEILSEEDRADLENAMHEYESGKTISLKDAEKMLGLG
ncbi:MAG: hypothetical protein ACE5KE_09325 [Methanosarcinales archaeon]